ncbi:hypothetical protein PMAYCL1PPCAC_25244, partial [Pristionchus mayeri]
RVRQKSLHMSTVSSLSRKTDQAGMKDTPPYGQFRVEFDKIPSNILEHYRKASIEMEVKGITWQAALCLNFSGIDCISSVCTSKWHFGASIWTRNSLWSIRT